VRVPCVSRSLAAFPPRVEAEGHLDLPVDSVDPDVRGHERLSGAEGRPSSDERLAPRVRDEGHGRDGVARLEPDHAARVRGRNGPADGVREEEPHLSRRLCDELHVAIALHQHDPPVARAVVHVRALAGGWLQRGCSGRPRRRRRRGGRRPIRLGQTRFADVHAARGCEKNHGPSGRCHRRQA